MRCGHVGLKLQRRCRDGALPVGGNRRILRRNGRARNPQGRRGAIPLVIGPTVSIRLDMDCARSYGNTEPEVALSLKDPETDRLAREVARLIGESLTEAEGARRAPGAR